MKKEKQLEQLRETQSAVNDLFLITNNHEISTILYGVMNKLDKVGEIINEEE